MENLFYWIIFVFYIVYSIYQSFQNEQENKKVVQDWEGKPMAGEKSIEEMLAEYLEPKREAAAAPKKEPAVVPSTGEDDTYSQEGGRSLAQELREIPGSDRKERERIKLEIDGDDTIDEEEEGLSPAEAYRRRREKERAKEQATKTLSAVEEYELLAAQRRKEREDLHATVQEREQVIIRDKKQLEDINKIYSRKKVSKKGGFKFNARDAIVYQIIMNRKY